MPDDIAPHPAPNAAYGSLYLQAGEILFEQGTIGRAAYLVESGEIEIYMMRDGQPHSLARRGEGELIGEISVIDRGPRSASARAATDCRLLVIDAAKLEGRAGASDPVLQMCLSVVVMRYRSAMAQLHAAKAGAAPDGADHGETRALSAPTPPIDEALINAAQMLRNENDLSRGLRDEEFVLFFQPIVHLPTRRLAGFEALMRWNHRTRGLVPPGSFIPMAEAAGLIVDLTRWAVAEIGRVLPLMIEAERGNPAGADRLFMTVNVSAADLRLPEFSKTVCDMLLRAGVEAERLKVEITESMIMTDITKAAEALGVLQQAGIGVAIDDFGTGYSSLSSLAALPISTLKIDRSFVQAMLGGPVPHRIVTTILRLAAELAIPTVAEGIETDAEATALAAMRCEYGQGYLFGRPVPLAAMLDVIRSWRPAP